MAAEEAQSRKKSGWVFTLDYPSYVPFMTYAENREFEEKMQYCIWSTRISRQSSKQQ